MKRGAAERWVAAVNADGTYGRWDYVLIKKAADIDAALDAVTASRAVKGLAESV
jgi:hypothetical protein